MKTIKGTYNEAKVFTDDVEDAAAKQILELCNNKHFSGNSIAIMPDVHAGSGCTIGTTMRLCRSVVSPHHVGVDIGCACLCVELYEKLDTSETSLREIDSKIRSVVPLGFNVNEKFNIKDVYKLLVKEVADTDAEYFADLYDRIPDTLKNIGQDDKTHHVLHSIGTLGGGNHFIELNECVETGRHYLVIHSGSRHFGKLIADYHQAKAGVDGVITSKEAYENYMDDMWVAAQYADFNRTLIAARILNVLEVEGINFFQTVHNIISDNTLRKGAVATSWYSHSDKVWYPVENILIPLNSRDGSVICRGIPNEGWNYSAPHGAGRKMSRSAAKKNLDVNEFKASMGGVFSTSVGEGTIDEAPAAYKDSDSILSLINGVTVDVKYTLQPILNIKA